MAQAVMVERSHSHVEESANELRTADESRTDVLDAGIDWLAGTLRVREREKALRAVAESIAEGEELRGSDHSPCLNGRYRGWKVGGISYGERREDTFIQLSGGLALEHWQEIAPFLDTVSRLDLQVTVGLSQPDTTIPLRLWEQVQAGTGRKGRPPTTDLILNSTGGRTCYLGSMKSDRYVRVYDKGIETGDAEAGAKYRYEAVWRRDMAKHQLASLEGYPDQVSAALAMVHQEVERKGCKSLWSPGHTLSSCAYSRPAATDRRLEWFRAQVAPAVVKAIHKHGRATVLEALGL